MENLFFEFKKPSNKFFEKLWTECLFVLDTNVLLNFYRYSEATFSQLEESLSYYKERIWIPHQVGVEFFKNRLNVIDEQKRSYVEANKNINKLKESLSSKRGHPFVSSKLMEDFNAIIEKIENEFSDQQATLTELVYKDKVIDLVFNLFANGVGNPYSNDELNKIYIEGNERYKNNVPPGFRDQKKTEPDRYNDFVIWKQLLDKSKSDNKPIVFISDDEKEDWVEINSNKILGPLPKLIREFKDLTNQHFYLYQTFNFLKHSYSLRNIEISQPTIDEIKQVSSSSFESLETDLYNFFSINFLIDTVDTSKENIDQLFTAIKAQGYNLNIQHFGSNIYDVSLNVPFEDLVRRFHKYLTNLLDAYNVHLVSYNSNKLLNSF